MSRKPASKSTSNTRKTLKTLKFTSRDDNDDAEPPSKRYRVNFATPVFDLTQDGIVTSPAESRIATPVGRSQRPSVDVKGKGKQTNPEDDVLWVDKYQPTSEAELAVHKRKVEDVRRWLLEAFEGGPSAKLRKYRRILALTGPAGTAKTATLRVLSRELDFEILEWRNTMSEPGPSATLDEEPNLDTESLFDKFQAFLTRAMSCNSIFSTQRLGKRQLVLLEDLPNLLHQPTQARFQVALRSLCIPGSHSTEAPGPPIVIILSDSGLRAEHPDDDVWDGGHYGRRWDKKEVLDIRLVLGPDLLTSPYVTCIGFNPIAPTLMTRALQTLLASHFGSGACERVGRQPARDVVDIVVGSSNGDIRSAIMALQFACVVDLPAASVKSRGKTTRKDARATNARAVLEAVTRREQSLMLFHLMGKILYNKRKFDAPASHLSAKDADKERESDTQLVDPQPLPVWLSHHDRKPSRVSIETLAAESPIDASLLGLYAHQNYTQFCTDVDQCDGVCEGLSWVDSMSSSSNSPYAFPALTLSTLHALPTPVPRKGQKVCKPRWFDVRSKELETLDAVADVLGWLGRGVTGDVHDGGSVSVGRWTRVGVATELGGWLRALDRCAGRTGDGGSRSLPPRTHGLFSQLPWSVGVAGGDALGENEDGEVEGVEGEGEGEGDVRVPGGMRGGGEGKGWLEEDDIEDVD